MTLRLFLAALIVAATFTMALAQSSTATTGTTTPMQSAPTSANPDPGQKIPPAARSGEKGLRVGAGAVTGDPVEIKRSK
jgi:hypothetical protein